MTGSPVVLTQEERDAATTIEGATRAELLEALTLLPSYQRAGVRWLAHVIREHRISSDPPSERPTRPDR